MATHYDELHSQGIRVRVVDDATSKGPFRADVSFGVTGRSLGGVEGCATVDRAIDSGTKHAQKFTY